MGLNKPGGGGGGGDTIVFETRTFNWQNNQNVGTTNRFDTSNISGGLPIEFYSVVSAPSNVIISFTTGVISGIISILAYIPEGEADGLGVGDQLIVKFATIQKGLGGTDLVAVSSMINSSINDLKSNVSWNYISKDTGVELIFKPKPIVFVWNSTPLTPGERLTEEVYLGDQISTYDSIEYVLMDNSNWDDVLFESVNYDLVTKKLLYRIYNRGNTMLANSFPYNVKATLFLKHKRAQL